jgi:hypothetical protein
VCACACVFFLIRIWIELILIWLKSLFEKASCHESLPIIEGSAKNDKNLKMNKQRICKTFFSFSIHFVEASRSAFLNLNQLIENEGEWREEEFCSMHTWRLCFGFIRKKRALQHLMKYNGIG